MTDRVAAEPPASRSLLTFSSGGWVLLLAGVLVTGLVVWRAALIYLSRGVVTVGDGEHVASYGFDFSTCLVSRSELVAAGFPKDGLPVMKTPRGLTLAEADELTHEMQRAHQGRFIVDKEAVLGVVMNGVARAYPAEIMTWHEVVNDVLGGVPIAVTYNPLCSSVVVFDRRVGEETLEFGVSGLVYNSNLVLYDRRDDANAESLWSQLQFRAIAGPAAARGARLTVLPVAMMRWQDWKKLHEGTTVLAPDMQWLDLYKRSYGEYFGTDTLRFPVAPLPPHDRPFKTPLIAVQVGGTWHAFAWDQIAKRVDASGAWETTVGGRSVRFAYRRDIALVGNPASTWVEVGETDEPSPVAYSFWFAWYAMQGGAVELGQ